MGFWIFMLIMDLLLPFTMIGFGRYFFIIPSSRHHIAFLRALRDGGS